MSRISQAADAALASGRLCRAPWCRLEREDMYIVERKRTYGYELLHLLLAQHPSFKYIVRENYCEERYHEVVVATSAMIL